MPGSRLRVTKQTFSISPSTELCNTHSVVLPPSNLLLEFWNMAHTARLVADAPASVLPALFAPFIDMHVNIDLPPPSLGETFDDAWLSILSACSLDYAETVSQVRSKSYC
jgi:hypothetical protein